MTQGAPKPLTGDYEIGRGRPPKESQFSKGQSGNPDGRPRGQHSRAKSPIDRLMKRGVSMMVGGKRKRVSITDFTTAKLVHEANKGSVPALRELNRMAEADAASQRIEGGKDVPRANFNVYGLYGSAREGLLLLGLASEHENSVVLLLPVVALGVQRLGRPLTDAEQRLLGAACPAFPAWYAARQR
jgi:uncharacterized protein DUF5681